MQVPLLMHGVACLGAAGAGFAVTLYLGARSTDRKRRANAKGMAAGSEASGMAKLECGAMPARVIRLALRESIKPSLALPRKTGFPHAGGGPSSSFETLVLKAGLSGAITRSGYDSSKKRLALVFLGAGAVLGSMFSLELALLLGIGGAFAGWAALPRALRAESHARKERIGSQLGEMVEVVALGLRSGLSFDRSFALYCEHFDSTLACDCAKAHQQWSIGLASREDALRSLADSYDSAVLSRVVKSIVRSLRFGSSLAETLESAAVESRSIHKAEVEERVAKAPIKMLVPVGTLILPAMLIFVLGPIMIDLMQGI